VGFCTCGSEQFCNFSLLTFSRGLSQPGGLRQAVLHHHLNGLCACFEVGTGQVKLCGTLRVGAAPERKNPRKRGGYRRRGSFVHLRHHYSPTASPYLFFIRTTRQNAREAFTFASIAAALPKSV